MSKSEHASELFNDNTLNLKNLANDSKADRNKKITDFVKELDKKDSKVAEKIKKVMKGTGKAKNNKILSFARGLNSVPGIITTFLIAPYILGWFIPNLTYANTRRIHKNRAKEKEQQQQIKIANA